MAEEDGAGPPKLGSLGGANCMGTTWPLPLGEWLGLPPWCGWPLFLPCEEGWEACDDDFLAEAVLDASEALESSEACVDCEEGSSPRVVLRG